MTWWEIKEIFHFPAITAKEQEIKTHKELCQYCSVPGEKWYSQPKRHYCRELLVLQVELSNLKKELKNANREVRPE